MNHNGSGRGRGEPPYYRLTTNTYRSRGRASQSPQYQLGVGEQVPENPLEHVFQYPPLPPGYFIGYHHPTMGNQELPQHQQGQALPVASGGVPNNEAFVLNQLSLLASQGINFLPQVPGQFQAFNQLGFPTGQGYMPPVPFQPNMNQDFMLMNQAPNFPPNPVPEALPAIERRADPAAAGESNGNEEVVYELDDDDEEEEEVSSLQSIEPDASTSHDAAGDSDGRASSSSSGLSGIEAEVACSNAVANVEYTTPRQVVDKIKNTLRSKTSISSIMAAEHPGSDSDMEDTSVERGNQQRPVVVTVCESDLEASVPVSEGRPVAVKMPDLDSSKALIEPMNAILKLSGHAAEPKDSSTTKETAGPLVEMDKPAKALTQPSLDKFPNLEEKQKLPTLFTIQMKGTKENANTGTSCATATSVEGMVVDDSSEMVYEFAEQCTSTTGEMRDPVLCELPSVPEPIPEVTVTDDEGGQTGPMDETLSVMCEPKTPAADNLPVPNRDTLPSVPLVKMEVEEEEALTPSNSASITSVKDKAIDVGLETVHESSGPNTGANDYEMRVPVIPEQIVELTLTVADDQGEEASSISETRNVMHELNVEAADILPAPNRNELPSLLPIKIEPIEDVQIPSTSAGSLQSVHDMETVVVRPHLEDDYIKRLKRMEQLAKERDLWGKTEMGRNVAADDIQFVMLNQNRANRPTAVDGSMVLLGPAPLAGLLQNRFAEYFGLENEVVIKSPRDLKHLLEQYVKDGKDSIYKYFVYMLDADADYNMWKNDFLTDLALLTTHIKEKFRIDVFLCRSVKNCNKNYPTVNVLSAIQRKFGVFMQPLHYDQELSLEQASEYSRNMFFTRAIMPVNEANEGRSTGILKSAK